MAHQCDVCKKFFSTTASLKTHKSKFKHYLPYLNPTIEEMLVTQTENGSVNQAEQEEGKEEIENIDDIIVDDSNEEVEMDDEYDPLAEEKIDEAEQVVFVENKAQKKKTGVKQRPVVLRSVKPHVPAVIKLQSKSSVVSRGNEFDTVCNDLIYVGSALLSTVQNNSAMKKCLQTVINQKLSDKHMTQANVLTIADIFRRLFRY